MSKTIMVQCRICKQKFNRMDPTLREGEYFVKPSKNWYYHKKCYDEYLRTKNNVNATMSDEEWFKAAWEFLTKDMKYSFNYIKVQKQWESFQKKKMTPKGMYFSLKYFYEIKKGDLTKSENGVGIIPYIYEESSEYWVKREESDRGICAAIEQQIIQATQQNKINVKLVERNKNKKTKEDIFAIIEEGEE